MSQHNDPALLLKTVMQHWTLLMWECVTAGCKAFSLANGKGTGTNDWVIRSLDD